MRLDLRRFVTLDLSKSVYHAGVPLNETTKTMTVPQQMCHTQDPHCFKAGGAEHGS